MSKKTKIKEYLLAGYSITPLEALNYFHSMRLGAEIFKLRKEGMDIETTLVRKGNVNYASYRLKTRLESNGQQVLV